MSKSSVVILLITAGAFTAAVAKQEQVKPDRPIPSIQKPIAAKTTCRPIRIDFWVQDKDGKLKLVGYTIVAGSCG